MFGYKFEMWNYGLYRLKEAEQHLNEMASKGYELVDITELWVPMALYKKVANSKKQYAVTLADAGTCSKDFIELVEESGWKLVEHTRFSTIVFSSESGQGREIFTDDESRVEHIYENLNNNGNLILSMVFLLIFIIAGIVFALKVANTKLILAITIIFILFAIILFLDNLAENLLLEKEIKDYKNGIKLERPKWIKIFHKVTSYINVIMLILVLIIKMALCYLNGNLIGAVIILMSCPIFIAGYLISTNKKLKLLGILIMFISVCAFISPSIPIF